MSALRKERIEENVELVKICEDYELSYLDVKMAVDQAEDDKAAAKYTIAEARALNKQKHVIDLRVKIASSKARASIKNASLLQDRYIAQCIRPKY